MLQQIKKFEGNAIAIEIIEGFTKEDEAMIEKLIQGKLGDGHKSVNLLLKLDEAKISKSEIKGFINEAKFLIKHVDNLNRIAVVGDSAVLSGLVAVDSVFYKMINKTGTEKYFDVSQLDEAMAYINQDE